MASSSPGSFHTPPETSLAPDLPSRTSMDSEDVDRVSIDNEGGSVSSEKEQLRNTLANISALGLSLTAESPREHSTVPRDRFTLEELEPSRMLSEEPRPFNKWVKSLQRRAAGARRQTVSCDTDSTTLEQEGFSFPSSSRRHGHQKSSSSSSSSFDFVTAMKSASISLASYSVAPKSKRTGVSSRHQRAERSSRTSNAGRRSEDSYVSRGTIMDQAVANRLIQRRRILEELISTEEGYVADVKFLMNVRE